MRLDHWLVSQGHFRSRDRAKEVILAGKIEVDQKIVLKPATEILDTTVVKVLQADNPYVSRGAVKLEGALKEFRVDVTDKVCLDVGVATGGFTDCLLRSGAKKVYAVDIGEGQLAEVILADQRVVFRNHCDARELKLADFQEILDVVVVDVSFISVTALIPALKLICTADTQLIVLIKPQFELGEKHSGVIRSEHVRRKILVKLRETFTSENFQIKKEMLSPILGKEGNQEYLWLLKKLN